MVRAFLALDLPEPVRRACAARVAELRARPLGDAVRWVRPESYHLTLRFLGNVDADVVPVLAERVEAAVAGSGAVAFRLGAPIPFPAPRRPRVVALPVEPEGVLDGLVTRLEEAVVAVGVPPESRSYRPHLSLGRMRGRRWPAVEGVAAPEPGAVRAEEVVLFRSELHRDGARYHPLGRASLCAGGGRETASPV
jgi:2'-5' RNA ligase